MPLRQDADWFDFATEYQERYVAEGWHVGGVLHRLDGPAIVLQNASGLWRERWVHGRQHRLDGPAVTGKVEVKRDGSHTRMPDEWWVNKEIMAEVEEFFRVQTLRHYMQLNDTYRLLLRLFLCRYL